MIEENEYDFDSSDEEDVQNTVGNIPLEWYDNCSHMGYDISGRPLMKSAKSGAIDSFINNVENQNKGLVIKDPNTGQNVILNEDILKIIALCSSRGYLSSFNEDEYDSHWFTRDVMQTPVSAHPPQKKSFIPSLLDKKRIGRMVHAMKLGRMKIPEPVDKDAVLDEDYESIVNMNTPDVFRDDYNKKVIKNVPEKYLQWLPRELQCDYQLKYQSLRQITRPPKEKPAENNESYRPADEYLLDSDERKKLISRFWDPSYNPNRVAGEKPLIPKLFPNLRSVPYSQAPIIDKQKRIRDLIYSTRVIKEKVNSSTEQILKQYCTPVTSDMKPYPNTIDDTVNVNDTVLSISVSYCGSYIATAGYEVVRIYKSEYGSSSSGLTTYCTYPISSLSETADKTEKTLRNPCLMWSPNSHLLAIALNNQVKIILPTSIDKDASDLESRMKEWYSTSLTKSEESTDEPSAKKSKSSSQWAFDKMNGNTRSFIPFSYFVINLEDTILDMSWHLCGDYLLTICGKGKATNSGGKVQMHRLSKCSTMSPFGDSNKKLWSHARFHSQKNQPQLFLAESNSSNIQVFDMAQKKLTRTLQVTGKTSCMEMHPHENHLIVGTFEGKICWFDLDMGITPFKVLNVNEKSVRSISMHSRYPLMSCSTASGSVVVFYAKVFSTFDNNPIITGVSMFKKLDKEGDAYTICFHPSLAKVFCGGAEKKLYTINSCH